MRSNVDLDVQKGQKKIKWKMKISETPAGWIKNGNLD